MVSADDEEGLDLSGGKRKDDAVHKDILSPKLSYFYSRVKVCVKMLHNNIVLTPF